MNQKIQVLCAAVLFLSYAAGGQILSTTSNFHTVGYKIVLPAGFDSDQTATVNIRYKAASSTVWWDGFPPERVSIVGQDAFIGSLFQLEPNSTYQLEATLLDSIPNVIAQLLPVQTISTRAEPHIVAGNSVKWVSPSGSGTAYSQASPGDLKTLLGSGSVTCGTTIYLNGGTYFIGEMLLNLTTDCTENTPINIMATPGETPIIDGGYTEPLVWTKDATDPKLYSAPLPPETAFSTLCLLDTVRLYPYPAVDQITWNGITHPYFLRALNLGENGFVRDASTIFIKTADGIDPNTKTVTLSKFKFGLVVYGNNKQNFLNFKGITFKNYGKPTVLDFGATIYSALSLELRDIHHLMIDSCKFEWNTQGVSITGNTSYVTIQNSQFKDQTGFWSHGQVKKSNDVVFQPLLGLVLPTTFGRSVENTAIGMYANSCKNYVVRNNNINGFCNGTSSNFAGTDPISEADFYGNTILNSYDGIECDGAWSNLRVWNNEIGNTLAGISLAPPQGGPTYVFRNVFHHIISRWNVADDPYYIGCQPVTTYFGWGVGIKTNSGIQGDAALYFINNTFHTADSLAFGIYSWDSEWSKMRWHNNIFYSENKQLIYMTSAKGNTDFQLYSDRDNYACPNGTLLQIKEIHGQFDCHSTNEVQEMQGLVQSITGSSSAIFKEPSQYDPLFVHAEGNDFSLQDISQLINLGRIIPGFYDFHGNAPDIGAKETGIISTTSKIAAVVAPLIFPNPTSGVFEIKTDDPIQSVAVFDALGKRVLVLDPTQRFDLTNHPNGVYFLKVTWAESSFWAKVVKAEK